MISSLNTPQSTNKLEKKSLSPEKKPEFNLPIDMRKPEPIRVENLEVPIQNSLPNEVPVVAMKELFQERQEEHKPNILGNSNNNIVVAGEGAHKQHQPIGIINFNDSDEEEM